MTSLTCRLGRSTLLHMDPGIGRVTGAPFRRIRDFSVSICRTQPHAHREDMPGPPLKPGDLSSARRHPLVREADSRRASRFESGLPPLRGGGMIGRTNRPSNCCCNNSPPCRTILYANRRHLRRASVWFGSHHPGTQPRHKKAPQCGAESVSEIVD